MTDDYTVDGHPATVRDGTITLHLDAAERAAVRAWLAEVERVREEAAALALGLGIEPMLKGEA